MCDKKLNFYFDFLSPYAYFAWKKIIVLQQKQGFELQIHPVVFGKLLDHWGQLGPAEIAPKREALYKYCYRYAALHGFFFNSPKTHPFNPLPALRLALASVCAGQQQAVVDAIFVAGWSDGKDIGEYEVLIDILNARGLDGDSLYQKACSNEAKSSLKSSTSAAIALGVFGVPTIIVDAELFWGNDQFDYIELYLAGKDPLDGDAVAAMLNRERGIDRKIIAKR